MMRCTRSRWVLVPLLCLCSLSFAPGCATRRSGLTERVIEPPKRVTSEDLRKKADDAWAEREEEERLVEAILYYKKAHDADPRNREILVRLSRSLYFLADGYLDRDEERLAKYDQGTYYGEKAMALNPQFKAQIDAGKPVIEAVDVLGQEDLEAAYWAAANLGKWAKLKGLPAIVRNKALIQKLLEKVNALDDHFYYAATSRYWGAFYSAAPAWAGGDLKKSRDYFDKALKIAPDFYAIKVLMAELYAPKAKDRALFEELLHSVVDGRPDVLPDVMPEQKVEQKKARDLLAREGEFFAK